MVREECVGPAEGERTDGGPTVVPFAVVLGAPLFKLPEDLYIPPDALEVFLETFEGPLDLLLYLIKRQNLDILDIPIARITEQYMEYVELMKQARLELAAEYLVMAAMLAEIKSRMLLPRPAQDHDEDQDPRAELIRRLQEYERFRQAALDIDALPRLDRDHYQTRVAVPTDRIRRIPPDVALHELLGALRDVIAREGLFASHRVEREALSVRERMTRILERLSAGGFVSFVELLDAREGRAGLVVTFLAVLELVKDATLELVQSEPSAMLHVRPRRSEAL